MEPRLVDIGFHLQHFATSHRLYFEYKFLDLLLVYLYAVKTVIIILTNSLLVCYSQRNV